MVITRAAHPFEGQELQAIGKSKRHGKIHFLIELPDQTRSLIPVEWTDAAGEATTLCAASAKHKTAKPALATIKTLLHTRVIVDALLTRTREPEEPDDETKAGTTTASLSTNTTPEQDGLDTAP